MSRSRKFFTLLVLGHERPHFRKLQLSYTFVGTCLLVGLLLAAGGLVAPHLLFRVQTQSVDLGKLQQENRRLWDERNQFEGALAEMQSQISEVEERSRELAEKLGVESIASSEAAAGGLSPEFEFERFWFDGEFRSLQSRSENLDRSIGELDDAFHRRERRLAATPSVIPVEGWFSHGYGWRKDPFTGRREFHHGLDIVADAGSPIEAPADGVVIRAARYGAYGKCVDLSHGFGYVTRYAHLKQIDVASGDRVKRGQAIGRVGSTGRSTGPHLHYEIFRDGRRVNPWKYLGRK